MVFEQNEKKKFQNRILGKTKFWKKNFQKFSSQNSVPEIFFDFVQKSFLTNFFLIVAEINLTSGVHCILVLLLFQKIKDRCALRY